MKKDFLPDDGEMFADEIRGRERRRQFQVPFWQLLSFLLHSSVFVALVLFTPLREIVIPKPKEREPIKISAERLERLSADLQTVRLNELLDQLNALQIMLHNMDVMKQSMMGDYDAFAMNEQGNAKESLETLFTRIIEEQSTAVDLQEQSMDVVKAINALHVQDIADTNISKRISETLVSARPTFAQIDSTQAVSQNLLDKVFVEAELVGLTKTAAASEVVRDVQLKANTMQREFQKNLENKVKSIVDYPTVLKAQPALKRKLNDLESNLETAAKKIVQQQSDSENDTKAAEKNEETLANQQAQRVDAQAAVEAAKKKVEDVSQQLTTVREERKVAGSSAELPEEEKRLTATVGEARRTEKTATEQLGAIEKRIRSTKKDLEKSRRMAELNAKGVVRDERWRDQIKDSIEKVRGDIGHNDWRKSEIEKIAKTSSPVLIQGQQDAITAQKELIKKVEEIAELAKLEVSTLELMAKEGAVLDPLTTQAVAQLDMVEAYELAKELESHITESYREIKSAEAAMIHKMSFNAAEKLTDVAKALRPEVDSELLKLTPRDSQTFDRQKAAAMEVVREADSMVETSEMLMVAAREIVQPDSLTGEFAEAPRRLERMYELAGLNQQLDAAAAEDADEKAKDLSALMTPASSSVAADLDQPFKVAEKKQLLDNDTGSSGKSSVPMAIPELGSKIPDLFPGNIIHLGPGGSGIPTTWMYVNSWYVIGPFPNPDRINLRRRFPPESVVDLEATYMGKDDRLVKWDFEQARSSLRSSANRALVIPQTSEEYGIWYAYAEVLVDEACDLWIAVGSDDRSDLWLNDMHVWGSSNELKSWSINEGFRKVHFKKGRNRFLARVENGWHSIAWSVCIALSDDISL